MKAPQTLPRPENWQDFESLCKKLWGEIWNCPEIKKNGRLGQKQSGVDIYGIPGNEDGYYGIQCKGISEYSNRHLSEKEIDSEIDKAKDFEPKLKKMYFATTALRDSDVEAYIRKINIEHRNKGWFEVHLFCWEDIVERIFENRATYDYYLNSHAFKKNHSVKVGFGNGEEKMSIVPKFLSKTHIAKSDYEEREKQAERFMPKFLSDQLKWQDKMLRNHGILDLGGFSSTNYTEYNRSFVGFQICVLNDGSEPLEHWKLTLDLPEEIVEVSDKNHEKNGAYRIGANQHFNFDTYIDTERHRVEIEPRKKILVGDDSFISNMIFIKPKVNHLTMELSWKLVSKNFKQEGSLEIVSRPEMEHRTLKVDDGSPLLLEGNGITVEDFLERVEGD